MVNFQRGWPSFGRNRGAASGPSTARPAGSPKRRGFTLSASTKRMLITAAVILILGFLIVVTARYWVNWWWFGSMGYRDVLVTRCSSTAIFFVIGFLLGGGVVLGNLVIAMRRSRNRRQGSDLPELAGKILVVLIIGVSVVVGFFVAVNAATHWQTWLLALNGDSFGIEDPVFGRDVGFYVFALPALNHLYSIVLWLMVATLVIVIVAYVLRLGINPRRYREFPTILLDHMLVLIAIILLLVAARYYLNNFELVYSERGPVTGVSYTDDNIQRWSNYMLVVVSLAVAATVVAGMRRLQIRWLLALGVAWVGIQVLVGMIFPIVVQRTVVEPSELRRETPYIENNLAMTRAAFAISEMEEHALEGQAVLTSADLQSQPQTIDNIRLWDYRFALQVFQQLQALERFYVFSDADVDRYVIDGQLTQVIVAPRELDISGLPENIQTWTNRRLAYTHGHGVVVSPVSEADSAGRPVFLVGGLGSYESAPIPITRPEIYFGELGGEWVIVNTNVTEYTESPNPVPYQGEAAGSFQLDDAFTRLVTAIYFGDRNIMLSGEITDESQLIYRRGILERVQEIAPFLQYDPDPYMVIADGRLVWVIDAYTTTDLWPNATRAFGVNYLRNSVKVVVDAYDGSVTFYRTNVVDPIADAYGDIYSDLFRPISEVPASISSHFRYPETLFEVQSEILKTHHVTDARTYFDGNDLWAIPPGGAAGDEPLEPYFVTMALPGQTNVDFTLIRPFIPGGSQNRQNMAAWMGGQLDEQGNPRLVLYRFPRDTPIFGPQQVEARIDQDTEIAPEITLLSQAGSEVLRGNLLVIPINQTVLYVQPLYVRAANSPGAYPELGKVIVASSDRVVMRDTLDEALTALVQGAPPVEPSGGQTAPQPAAPAPAESDAQPAATPVAGDTQTLADEALAAYERAQQALAEGDWATYGQELARMESILQQLAGEEQNPAASPSPAATPPPQ